MAVSYVRQTDLPWPLLLDPDRQMYARYQMGRGEWSAIYGPSSIWHYLRLIGGGRRLQRPGSDWRQLGGDVLIDQDGIIRFHFVSAAPHDRPAVEEMLELIPFE